MKMSLWDMDALKGVPTQNKQHAKNNQRGSGLQAGQLSLNTGNYESHLPDERGLKLMPIAESANNLILV
jgi:hypothetical protein